MAEADKVSAWDILLAVLWLALRVAMAVAFVAGLFYVSLGVTYEFMHWRERR